MAKRTICKDGGNVEGVNPKVDAFIEDIHKVCRKHGFSISHEDTQGAFIVLPYNYDDAEWFAGAKDATQEGGAS